MNNKIDLNSNNVLVDFTNTRKYFSYERDENGNLIKYFEMAWEFE